MEEEFEKSLEEYMQILKVTEEMIRKGEERQALLLETINMAQKESEDEASLDENSHDEEIGRAERWKRGKISQIKHIFSSEKNILLELMHRIVFFIASCHFQLKNETLEKEYYQKAEDLRSLTLQPLIDRFNKQLKDRFHPFVKKTNDKLRKNNPIIPSASFQGGLMSSMVIEEFDELISTLNHQWYLLREWRDKILDLLSTPLIDEGKEGQPTGDEYDIGLENQIQVEKYLVIRFSATDKIDGVFCLNWR
jgi:E3 ubiquitin-protein ligase SHPRH